MAIDRDAFHGRPLFYDDPEGAEELAKKLGVEVKHAEMLGNPHFKTFSVVITPSQRDHLKPQKGKEHDVP